MTQTIPVIRIDDLGQPQTDFRGRPCIDLKFGLGRPTDLGDGSFSMDLLPVRALIDTGAELSLIDDRLIPSGHLPKSQLPHGGTTGSHLADVHEVTLGIEPPGAFLTLDFLTLPAAIRPFKVILGRDALKHFDFDWRSQDGIVSLRYTS